MITTIARATVWGASRLLGVRDDEPLAHHDLEHAHWDRVARRWYTHEESAAARESGQRDRVPGRAAIAAAEQDQRGAGERLVA